MILRSAVVMLETRHRISSPCARRRLKLDPKIPQQQRAAIPRYHCFDSWAPVFLQHEDKTQTADSKHTDVSTLLPEMSLFRRK
jgi:hypothetical protein